MRNSLTKKMVAILSALSLLICNTYVLAFYEPGDITFEIGDILLEKGETEYEFYLPFDAASINLALSGDADITLATEQQTVNISEGDTKFGQVERKGEKKWTFTSSANVTLTGVQVLQYDLPRDDKIGKSANTCNITDEEYAISTALLVHKDASCIFVGGARRYIDYNDTTQTPKIFDGSMYLPGRTLALAFGCYYESVPEKNYILLRDDYTGREFYFTTNSCYEQLQLGTKKDIPFHPVYVEGNDYLPVRCMAELLGKKVEYKDGIAVIDDKYAVDKIINTDVFDYVVEKFEPFTHSASTGKVYHVAQTNVASDSNPGSEDKPFLTLEKAAEKAVAGDTVIIHEGTYREVLSPQNDGTAVSPIVFKAAENENVVISATEKISGFQDIGNGRVSKTISYDMGEGRNQVFYNDECIAEARYPDGPNVEMSDNGEALSPLFPVKGDLKVNVGTDRSLVTSDTLLNEDTKDFWRGATFLSVHGYGYAVASAKVTSSEKGKLHLSDFSTKWWVSDDNPGDNGWNFGFLTGHINAINRPGEWVIADNEIIMIPPDGETAQTLSVEVKARQLVMDLSERKFVQVQGVNTFGGGVKLNESEMCVLNDVDMKYISHYTLSDDQREGYIDNYDVAARKSGTGAPQRGEVGVYISGRDNAVINSSIDHSAASGLYLAGLYAYVDNNVISNCGYMGSYVSGITAYSEPWTDFYAPRGGFSLYNNTVYNSCRYLFIIQGNEDGIWNGGVVPFLPFEVAFNDFHDGILCTLDAGPVYAYWINASTDRQRSRIHSNYIYSTTPESNPYGFGLYCDGGSQGIDGYNNVVFTTQEGTKFTKHYAYRNSTLSTATLTSNAQLTKPVNGGAAGLEAKHFPKSKPFYAGQISDFGLYMKNYERTDESVEYISVADAVRYGNVNTASDGGVVLLDSEAYVCFEDVDFNGGINQLELYFGSDRYIKGEDVARVVIGDSPDGNDRMEIPFSTDASGLYQLDYCSVDIGERSGVHNIYVSVPTQNAFPRIYGVMLSDNAKEVTHDYKDIKAIDYNAMHKLGTDGVLYTKVEGDYIRNTYPGTMLVFKNVTLAENVNGLAILIGQDPAYNDRKIKIRIDSPTAEPVSVYPVTATGWFDKTIKYQSLDTAITAGTYDIYVEFTGHGTSNLFSFGFLPSIPTE